MEQPVIIPAILAKSRAEFSRKLRLMNGVTRHMHVDVMDGKFVPNKTWHDAKVVARMKTNVTFELHLMVRNPLPVIVDWMKVKGLRHVIVHVESPVDIRAMIREARARCLDFGLAISPGTPLKKVLTHLKQVDEILVMGGKPGFSGKPLDSNTIETVRAIRKRSKTIPIGFDIGVSRETIPTLVHAGVTRLVSTHAIFRATHPQTEVASLQRIADQAMHR